MHLEDELYAAQPRHLLAFGPVLDETGNYGIANLAEFMTRFSDFNRIILASTPNLPVFLPRCRLSPWALRFCFNLASWNMDKPKRKRKTVEV